jgi:pimeloyl-ACP methyl ester carboxylesterase
MKKLLALIPVLVLLAPAAAAQAAPADPFGHACTPQNGVRFCPTANDAQRVPSWDGVPLDVDVTLPASGDGPFPTIVMLHGWGGSKDSFESATPEGSGSTGWHYNNNFFAKRGYAVITPSSRGFGRSCGAMDSRTSPGCDKGWVRLADHRYEGRDVQHLLGLLVDQDILNPKEIGVTGISYGGIQSLSLARLRNRIRLPNGSYRRWRSPKGTKLSIAAAFPRWGGSDLTYALQPNGRFLDFRDYHVGQSIDPAGVQKQSYVGGLYASGAGSGFYATAGAPFSADLPLWKQLTDAGEPETPQVLRVGRELTGHHSIAGLTGVPAPLLVENGWTDDLLPVEEALRVWRMFRKVKGARVTLQFGDLGHPRGANKAAVDHVLNTQGVKFFNAYLKGAGRGPQPGSVTAFTETCPADAPAGGPFHARSWERLAPGAVAFSAGGTQRVTSSGGDPDVAAAINPIGGKPACEALAATRASGTAVAQRRIAKPFTLLGLPTVRARIRTKGRGGMIAARLWDVDNGKQLLVTRGVYRLEDNQKGKLVFQLFGNGWKFARGHTARLELLGSDSSYLRTSNFDFSVKVSKLRVSLPTHGPGR